MPSFVLNIKIFYAYLIIEFVTGGRVFDSSGICVLICFTSTSRGQHWEKILGIISCNLMHFRWEHREPERAFQVHTVTSSR